MISRNVTNRIRDLLDNYLPPVIRDSYWFMYPLFYFAYKGKNIKQAMKFKDLVYTWSEKQYSNYYANIDSISRNRPTDINTQCIQYILQRAINCTSLCDIGCGKGYILQEIHKKNPQAVLTGVDIVRIQSHTQFQFLKAPIESIPLETHSQDIVLCSHVLEHIIDPQKALQEIFRIAKHRVILVIPKQKYFYYTLDEHVNFFPDSLHIHKLMQNKEYSLRELNGDWLIDCKIK